MITRIVKMKFDPDKVNDFLEIFEKSKSKIRAFEGCCHLQLLQDVHSENAFFTYSLWDTEESLNRYRDSALFKKTWASTKVLFIEKPEAWSTKALFTLA